MWDKVANMQENETKIKINKNKNIYEIVGGGVVVCGGRRACKKSYAEAELGLW